MALYWLLRDSHKNYDIAFVFKDLPRPSVGIEQCEDVGTIGLPAQVREVPPDNHSPK